MAPNQRLQRTPLAPLSLIRSAALTSSTHMKSYFVKRHDNSRYEGMFSQTELIRELKAGNLKPEWLAAENPEGVSYNQFIKIGEGQWSSLSDFSAASSTPEESLASGITTSTTSEQSPEAFLGAVRARSCYSTLRSMISVFSKLSIIGILALAGFYVVLGSQTGNALPLIVGAVIGILGCFLVIASKQASLLLVDIADTLIEQNRRKKRETE